MQKRKWDLFSLLCPFDVLVLLISGSSLGDQAVESLVVPIDQISEVSPSRNPDGHTRSNGLNTVLAIILGIVLFVALLVSIFS